MLVALFTIHFAMTFVYNQPLNAVKLRVADTVSAWMHPYFAQNWNLFAPQPINENRGMLVRARLREPDGKARVTRFLDITTPANREAQERRWWPSRRTRLVSGTLQMLTYEDPVALTIKQTRARLQREQGRDESAADGPDGQVQQGLAGIPPTSAERSYRLRALNLTARLATLEAAREFGDRVEAVQVRVVRHTFPRFSKRDHPDAAGDVGFEDLPWMPASR
ncbi:MAG: DUF5819 family protein [Actinomycetota bacterium]|nr:DUF5819 family protein [Actinomycetota bacterium]